MRWESAAPFPAPSRLGRVTYALARHLIRTPYITLFNISAQAFVAPELVQDACTGPKLAHEVALRLDDADLCSRQVAAKR